MPEMATRVVFDKELLSAPPSAEGQSRRTGVLDLRSSQYIEPALRIPQEALLAGARVTITLPVCPTCRHDLYAAGEDGCCPCRAQGLPTWVDWPAYLAARAAPYHDAIDKVVEHEQARVAAEQAAQQTDPPAANEPAVAVPPPPNPSGTPTPPGPVNATA